MMLPNVVQTVGWVSDPTVPMLQLASAHHDRSTSNASWSTLPDGQFGEGMDEDDFECTPMLSPTEERYSTVQTAVIADMCTHSSSDEPCSNAGTSSHRRNGGIILDFNPVNPPRRLSPKRHNYQTGGNSSKRFGKVGAFASFEDTSSCAHPGARSPTVAATPRQLRSHMGELRDELTCPICLEPYRLPITVPCGHTFCRYCISQGGLRRHVCPLCRTSIGQTLSVNLVLHNVIKAMGLNRPSGGSHSPALKKGGADLSPISQQWWSIKLGKDEVPLQIFLKVLLMDLKEQNDSLFFDDLVACASDYFDTRSLWQPHRLFISLRAAHELIADIGLLSDSPQDNLLALRSWVEQYVELKPHTIASNSSLEPKFPHLSFHILADNLQRVQGNHISCSHVLTKLPWTCGRHASSVLPLPHGSVSLFHFLIMAMPSTTSKKGDLNLGIVDCGSLLGTMIKLPAMTELKESGEIYHIAEYIEIVVDHLTWSESLDEYKVHKKGLFSSINEVRFWDVQKKKICSFPYLTIAEDHQNGSGTRYSGPPGEQSEKVTQVHLDESRFRPIPLLRITVIKGSWHTAAGDVPSHSTERSQHLIDPLGVALGRGPTRTSPVARKINVTETNPFVSREHCILFYGLAPDRTSPSWTLHDVSTIGTYRKLSPFSDPVRLEAGTVFKVGQCKIEVINDAVNEGYGSRQRTGLIGAGGLANSSNSVQAPFVAHLPRLSNRANYTSQPPVTGSASGGRVYIGGNGQGNGSGGQAPASTTGNGGAPNSGFDNRSPIYHYNQPSSTSPSDMNISLSTIVLATRSSDGQVQPQTTVMRSNDTVDNRGALPGNHGPPESSWLDSSSPQDSSLQSSLERRNLDSIRRSSHPPTMMWVESSNPCHFQRRSQHHQATSLQHRQSNRVSQQSSPSQQMSPGTAIPQSTASGTPTTHLNQPATLSAIGVPTISSPTISGSTITSGTVVTGAAVNCPAPGGGPTSSAALSSSSPNAVNNNVSDLGPSNYLVDPSAAGRSGQNIGGSLLLSRRPGHSRSVSPSRYAINIVPSVYIPSRTPAVDRNNVAQTKQHHTQNLASSRYATTTRGRDPLNRLRGTGDPAPFTRPPFSSQNAQDSTTVFSDRPPETFHSNPNRLSTFSP